MNEHSRAHPIVWHLLVHPCVAWCGVFWDHVHALGGPAGWAGTPYLCAGCGETLPCGRESMPDYELSSSTLPPPPSVLPRSPCLPLSLSLASQSPGGGWELLNRPRWSRRGKKCDARSSPSTGALRSLAAHQTIQLYVARLFTASTAHCVYSLGNRRSLPRFVCRRFHGCKRPAAKSTGFSLANPGWI